MKLLFLVTLIAAMALGNIVPTSLHIYDAVAMSQSLVNVGYSEDQFITGILEGLPGEVSYFVRWNGINYTGSDADFTMVGATFASAAMISETTSWSSTYVVAYFENKMVIITTANARWYIDNISSMTTQQGAVWWLSNVAVVDVE